jgi:hypothetical protein
LLRLYSTRGIQISPGYAQACDRFLGPGLAYATPMMRGVTATLLSNPTLLAFNLVQNAIDEAKGAARVKLIADRHATGDLASKMRRHVADEFKHSVQFRKLLAVVEVANCDRDPDEVGREVASVLEFDDDLQVFICRIHSIEIRSWTVLRNYIDILSSHENERLHRALQVLEDIMADEINHVLYTGQQVSEWIEADPRGHS